MTVLSAMVDCFKGYALAALLVTGLLIGGSLLAGCKTDVGGPPPPPPASD